MAKLVITQGGNLIESRFLEDGRLTLGRAESVDILLAHPVVSKQHVAIDVVGSDHILRDLGSANGTFVNGVRVERHLLKHGDVLSVHDFEIRYVDHKSVVAPEGERTTLFRTGEFVVVAGDEPGVPNLAPAARTANVALRGGTLRIVGGPRVGHQVAVDGAVHPVGGVRGDRAAILRRPRGCFVARVAGRAPKVNGETIGEGWHPLRDRDVIDVADEKYEFRVAAR